MTECELSKIISHFKVSTDIAPYSEGHINDTSLADSTPYKFMDNIALTRLFCGYYRKGNRKF